MAKVALLQPPLRVSRDFVDYPYHCDLSVVQGAASLAAAGHEVDVVDAFALDSSTLTDLGDNEILLGADPAVVVDRIDVAATEVLVVAFTSFHRPPARDPYLGETLQRMRRDHPDTPILLADLYQSGQHYVAVRGADILRSYPEVDVLLQHEAEGVLSELCATLAAQGRPETPYALSGGEFDALDTLPLPAWERIDLAARDRFLANLIEGLGRGDWAFPADGRTLPAITSRGCPYRCGHCSSNPGRGSRAKLQRRHTPADLKRLVDHLVAHGATRIDFLDEMVNVEPDHFDALLDALAPHDVRYDFPNGMRADFVEPRHLEAMAPRITTLSVSAESGVQRVVDQVVGKRLDLKAIERTIDRATQAGISTIVHFIIGMPGETKREINETLEYALRMHESYGAWPSVQYATPLPGTRLAETTEKAAGAPLPVVDDYSPLFQQIPVTRSEEFTPEELHRFKWTFDQRLQAGTHPNKVIMNVTYRCNNRCTFCAVGTRTQLDGSFEKQRATLEDYREKGVDLVDFDGGEPTMYEHLIPLIQHAVKIGYRAVNVTSNGRMCTYEDYAKRLVRSGLSTLLFSVHGHDQKTHAQNVGVEEAFEQTLDGIRNCVKHRPLGVELGMNVTITKSNHEHLPAMTQLCWDLGLCWLNIQFLTPFGRATRFVNPDTQAAANIAMKVMDEWSDRIKFQIINLPFCFMPGYEKYMMGDLQKIQRHMVFVNNEDVNLAEYLEEQRGYAKECYECPHKTFCGGFYELKKSPELPWLFTQDDVNAPG